MLSAGIGFLYERHDDSRRPTSRLLRPRCEKRPTTFTIDHINASCFMYWWSAGGFYRLTYWRATKVEHHLALYYYDHYGRKKSCLVCIIARHCAFVSRAKMKYPKKRVSPKCTKQYHFPISSPSDPPLNPIPSLLSSVNRPHSNNSRNI